MDDIQRLLQIASIPNLAGELSTDELHKLGDKVCREYERDEMSREEWCKRSEKAMEQALQVAGKRPMPLGDFSADVKLPFLTVAAMQFHARAYPAVMQTGGVVKGKVTGEDPQGMKLDRAERVSKHMNYQLTEEMVEWDEQTDAMLLALPIEGCEFKKTYYDPLKGRNVSEWVRPKNFVVNYSTKSLKDCPRMTHVVELYPHQIAERMRAGTYREVDLRLDSETEEEEKPQKILEQHRLEDLDGDGVKEPYIVTVHEETKEVLRIKARWEPTGIVVNSGQETHPAFVQEGTQTVPHPTLQKMPPEMLMHLRLVKVEGEQYFTKYSFIPSPDGGFYDIGFGQLIGPLTEASDSIMNRLLDSGTLANIPMGFLSEGLKMVNNAQGTGEIRFKPGEFKKVKAGSAGKIADQIYQFKFPEPSPVLFSLLGFVTEQISSITAVKDVMTGQSEGQNTPVGTTMALIEQGLKVFSAIYKRIYRSLGHEMRRIYRLNSIYLSPVEYFRVTDSPVPLQIQIMDYQGDGTDVQPVADPNMATTMQRMARAQFAMQLAQSNPHINGAAATKMVLEAGELPTENLFIEQPPQPPPDPKLFEMQAKVEKMGAETEKIKAETVKTYNDMQAQMVELQQKYEQSAMEFRRSLEELDLKRIGQLMDYFSKVVTETENYQIHKELRGSDELGPVEAATGNQGVLEAGQLPDSGGGTGPLA